MSFYDCSIVVAPLATDTPVVKSLQTMHVTNNESLTNAVIQKLNNLIVYFCENPSSMIAASESTSSDPLVNSFLKQFPYLYQIPSSPLTLDSEGKVKNWRENPFKYDSTVISKYTGNNNVPCSSTIDVFVDIANSEKMPIDNPGYDKCQSFWFDKFSTPVNGKCIASTNVVNSVTGETVTLVPNDEERNACIEAGGSYDNANGDNGDTDNGNTDDGNGDNGDVEPTPDKKKTKKIVTGVIVGVGGALLIGAGVILLMKMSKTNKSKTEKEVKGEDDEETI